MGARGRNCAGENYEIFGEDATKTSRTKGCMERFTHRLCRPLRIFQFLTTLLLFAMTVYMSAMELGHLTDLASILLIILTSAYLFFMAIDIISQFEAHELPDAPMFLFSLFGMLFFAIAGALLIQYSAADTFWALVLAKILCFIVSLLFLMEVTMLLTSWRQRCVSWTRCYPYTAQRDCGRPMLFPGDDTCRIDVEIGRNDATTSVSNNEISMEDIETVVAQHGRRRITVGHRRQYVDRDSSAPALSAMHIAAIQTDRERTTITECQTQRTETKEMVIQTNSRCELCNRQMDDRSVSPTKLSTQSASVASQSQCSPSPRLSSVPPYTDQAVLAIDRVHSDLPTPTTPDPSIQGTTVPCTVCPAFLQMMREGIASPCCKSCKCEAGKHDTGRVREALSEGRNPEIQSVRWSQREQQPQRTPKPSSTAKPPGSESPSTKNEKSDAERSDLMIEEGNRRRPNKKISRLYETRQCPSHGSGLAARMAGLPETVTTVTLSSICVRRNKRTQTPNKDSFASRDNGNNGVNDQVIPNERTIEKPSENRQIEEEERTRSRRDDDTNERTSEDRIKLRISSCVTPRKLYRNSGRISPTREPETTPTADCCIRNKCRVLTESPRPVSWKSDERTGDKFTEIGKIETRSIMSEESTMKEGAIEEPRTRKYRTPINEETIQGAELETTTTSKCPRPSKEERIEDAEVDEAKTRKFRSSLKEERRIEDAEVEGSRTRNSPRSFMEATIEDELEGARTSKFRRPVKEENIENSEIEGPRSSKFRRSPDESPPNSTTGREKKSRSNASAVTDPKGSVLSVSGPVLRLRLEKSADPSTISDAKSDPVESSRVSLAESRTPLRSRSRGLPSITGSEILSDNRKDCTSHRHAARPRQESNSVWRSLDSKETSTPRDKSANSRECIRGEVKTACGEACPPSPRTRDNDKTGYESSGCEEETDEKLEASSLHKDNTSRAKRTKRIIQ